jgi:prevent-host-death family protein
MSRTVNLYEAKTHLSSLVEEAAEGEEIVIAKNGIAKARLVPIAPTAGRPRVPVNAMGLTYIAEDFDAPLPDLERFFENGE